MPQLERILSLKNVLVFFILVATVLLLGQVLDILLMLFAAFVLTCAMNPILGKLQKYMPRGLAVALLVLVITILLLGIIIPLCVFALEQFANLVKTLPQYVDNFQNLLNFKIFGFSLSKILNLEALKANSSTILSGFFTHTLEAGKGIASSVTGVFAVAIMVFYLASDENHLKNSLVKFFPSEHKQRAGEIFDAISTRVGGYFFATIISMAFVGLVSMLGLLIIGHKQAVLVGFLTFILDLIPVIGPTIAVIIGLLSAISGGFGFVILTLVVLGIAQWLENQIVRPLVFGKLMDMHPILIIISLLVGARFFGVWGVILGPAIASVVCVLVDELYIKNNQET